ncbi:MAG: tyrosine-type recombinase/integrase [Cardiobacteriaceae bacterium]|nr:tyrosine-type recombinase/integrase [Cardiobacteriaceae bacterium]
MHKAHKRIMAQYQKLLEDSNLTVFTIKDKLKVAQSYLVFLDSMNITLAEVEDIHIYNFMQTKHALKANSYNKILSYSKSFWRFLIQYYGMKDIKISLQRKREQKSLPKNVPLDQMLTLCTPLASEKIESLKQLRAQAIIEFLFSTGVRSIELINLQLADLSPDYSECFVNTAKRGNDRLVFLGSYARKALRLYLNKRFERKAKKTDWLFANDKNEQISYKSLHAIVHQLACRRLGFHISPHRIRHTFATEMLRATGCLRSVQDMLGHVQIVGTAIYCSLDFHDKDKAVQLFHPNGNCYEASSHQEVFDLDKDVN